MSQQRNRRKVVVVSHKVVYQPDDDIVSYLNQKKYQEVLHIMHSFANAPDRKSRYVWYKNGSIFKQRETKDYTAFPEPFLYIKEFYFTILWILQTKSVWDIYIGLDGLCILFGNTLRFLSKVKKTIFWAIDFVPADRFDSKITNHLYKTINRYGVLQTNEMWDLSPRMLSARKEYYQIDKNDYKLHRVVPYGLWLDRISPVAYKNCEKNTIIFMGNLTKYQGLQLIIQALPKLIKVNPSISLTVVGEGAYTEEIKKLVKKLNVGKHCQFLGRVKDAAEMEKIIAKSAIAVAPYLKEMDNISRYADPGKVKTYLACGVPVLLTQVPWNAKEVQDNKCGIIIEESEEDIIKKMLYLLKPNVNKVYRKNALQYASNFDFKTIFGAVSL